MHHYPEKSVRLRFYAAALILGEPWPVDCAAVAWVRPKDLASYAFPEADRELVALLAR